ncbi:MAG: hypothetical protein ACD_23C00200G0004, partial [uncultured bacterium]
SIGPKLSVSVRVLDMTSLLPSDLNPGGYTETRLIP